MTEPAFYMPKMTPVQRHAMAMAPLKTWTHGLYVVERPKWALELREWCMAALAGVDP